MGEPHDRVDSDLETWVRTWPDFDTEPAAVVHRLCRVTALAERELEAILDRFGLTRPGFDMLTALRRLGRPDHLSQSELLAELRYTSGTLSVRLGRLEEAGLVSRRRDPTDRRGAIVELTEAGRRVVDAAVPKHVETERRLLDPLGQAERRALTVLLRTLLSGLEASEDAGCAVALLGVSVVRPRHASALRRSVGLADRPGVLVEEVVPDGSAARAGLRRGDLIVAARAGASRVRRVHGPADLASALSSAGRKLVVTVVRGSEERSVTLHLR